MTTRTSKKILPRWAGISIIFATWLIFIAGRASSHTLFNYINGSGMAPALNQDDIVVTALDKDYERFDFAAYTLTADQSKIAEEFSSPGGTHIGRIVGLPGELIELTEDAIFINRDKLLSITVEGNDDNTYFPEAQIPIDEYFLLLDSNISRVGKEISAFGVDSRYFGFINSNQMRKVIKIYAKSSLPWSADTEILSGFSILFFIIIFPLYIKRISRKSLIITILIVIGYIFLSLIFTYVALSGDRLFNISRILLAFHYYYMGGLTALFGNSVISVLMTGLGGFAAVALSMLSIYEFFLKQRKSTIK